MKNSHPAAFAGINLACGGKLCRAPGWINADQSPSERGVIKVNLLKALPFADNSFDVVYHSQFIEHLPAEWGRSFTKECLRILKPGGVLRVATPDLQNQAEEYIARLKAVLAAPEDDIARLQYGWMRMEMLDQLTRHAAGGDMVEFLQVSGRQILPYLVERMGRSGANLIPTSEGGAEVSWVKQLARYFRSAARRSMGAILPAAYQIGAFRQSGESHLCMYDEFLLRSLLRDTGFIHVAKVGAMTSRIAGWNGTLLDCDEQGHPDCGESLFMEAVKPA